MVQGYSHSEMAAALGVANSTITEDVRWNEENCRRESADLLRVEWQIGVRRLEELHTYYMQGYFKTQQERKKKYSKIKRKGGAAGDTLQDGDEVEQGSVTEETPAGDVRFLNGARDTTVKRLEFTVGYPPVKAIVARAENVAAWRKVIEAGLTAEELQALERIQAKVIAAQLDGGMPGGNGNGHLIDVKAIGDGRDGGDAA